MDWMHPLPPFLSFSEFFPMVTEFFWLVGIQEMGIPEAINHAIEQLPIGTWFICTKCCGCTVQPSSKTAFTLMLLQNHLVLNCFHDWMLSVLYHNYKLRLLLTSSVFKVKINLNWNSPASQYSLSFAVSYRLNFINSARYVLFIIAVLKNNGSNISNMSGIKTETSICLFKQLLFCFYFFSISVFKAQRLPASRTHLLK